MKRSSFHRPSTRGFTLVEMLLTLGIFVMLSAAVFEIITGTLKGASTLQDNQFNRDQIVALNAFLKKKLSELPAQSTLTSYKRGDGEGLVQDGIIFGQDELVTAIDAKIQANGYYTLRYATFNAPPTDGLKTYQLFERAITDDDQNLHWAPLIRDVKNVTWKFQDENATQWADRWINDSAKPNLIEFVIQQAADLKPATMDFWVPRLQPPPGQAPNTTP